MTRNIQLQAATAYLQHIAGLAAGINVYNNHNSVHLQLTFVFTLNRVHNQTGSGMSKPQHKQERKGNNDNSSRLYLALWPDRDTQNRLQSMRHTWTWPQDASVVKPESLHLTLHFLGAVPDIRIPELVRALTVPVQPFDLILSRPQLWPQGVAVLKPSSVPAELMQLHDSLGTALRTLEIPIETRTYRPHVTLARNAALAIPPTSHQVQPVLWHVAGYALVKSHNGYCILQSYL